MKLLPLLMSLPMFSICSFAQPDFSRLPYATDSTYGYTATNPLHMKKGNPGRSIGYAYDFLSGLATPDLKSLRFVERNTVDNPRSNNPGTSLDEYIFVTRVEKDTLVIYVDIHRKGKLRIPMGLKYK